MRIRPAERADEERLGTIRHDAILALAVPILSQQEAETWAKQISEDRIGQAVRSHEVWVAEDEIAIGWVEIDKDRIAALYVSPDYAGSGIGSSLLMFAEASIFRSGYRSVQLEAIRSYSFGALWGCSAALLFATKEAVKFSLTASFVANGLSIYVNFIVQQVVKRDLEQRGNFAQHGDVGCFFSAL